MSSEVLMDIYTLFMTVESVLNDIYFDCLAFYFMASKIHVRGLRSTPPKRELTYSEVHGNNKKSY